SRRRPGRARPRRASRDTAVVVPCGLRAVRVLGPRARAGGARTTRGGHRGLPPPAERDRRDPLWFRRPGMAGVAGLLSRVGNAVAGGLLVGRPMGAWPARRTTARHR